MSDKLISECRDCSASLVSSNANLNLPICIVSVHWYAISMVQTKPGCVVLRSHFLFLHTLTGALHDYVTHSVFIAGDVHWASVPMGRGLTGKLWHVSFAPCQQPG